MGYVQSGVIVILVVILLCLLVYIRLYTRNLRSIRKQIANIMGKDTNAIVRVEAPQKDVCALAESINELIKYNRETLITAKKSDQRVREVITNISHDLRTPLTTAGGYIGMIKDSELPWEERLEYIEIIEERQEMVRTLLDQLFYYARMEAGNDYWNEKAIDIHKILSECLAMYYNDFESKGVEPDIRIVDCRMMVLGDEDGMRRVFSNIISNGLKHGWGRYQVELHPAEGGYEFLFSNESDRIEEAELEMLFDRSFSKITSKSTQSTGLGLTIAKELVERMNGTISAHYSNPVFMIKVFLPKYEKE